MDDVDYYSLQCTTSPPHELMLPPTLAKNSKVGQKEMVSKLARGSRCDPYSFCRKGNKNQYRFCKDMEDKKETHLPCRKGHWKRDHGSSKRSSEVRYNGSGCLATTEGSRRSRAALSGTVPTSHSSQKQSRCHNKQNTWEPTGGGRHGQRPDAKNPFFPLRIYT